MCCYCSCCSCSGQSLSSRLGSHWRMAWVRTTRLRTLASFQFGGRCEDGIRVVHSPSTTSDIVPIGRRAHWTKLYRHRTAKVSPARTNKFYRPQIWSFLVERCEVQSPRSMSFGSNISSCGVCLFPEQARAQAPRQSQMDPQWGRNRVSCKTDGAQTQERRYRFEQMYTPGIVSCSDKMLR
jgi:hypothetical protein